MSRVLNNPFLARPYSHLICRVKVPAVWSMRKCRHKEAMIFLQSYTSAAWKLERCVWLRPMDLN